VPRQQGGKEREAQRKRRGKDYKAGEIRQIKRQWQTKAGGCLPAAST